MSAMGQRFLVANSRGEILYDTYSEIEGGTLSIIEKWSAIKLQNNGTLVGYLVPKGGPGSSGSSEELLLQRLNMAALISALVGGGLALLLGLFLSARLIRPIHQLTSASEKMTDGDLSQRVQVTGKDELAVLGNTFNNMAASLQNAEEIRKSMTADIAHELRNPLSIQKAQLEALEDGIYPLTKENLLPIMEQNQALNRLVDDLRTVAMVDAGQLDLEFVPIDISSLVDRVATRFRPQAESKSVQIICNIQHNISKMYLDPGRIEQILNNLLSNALRFTPDGGSIQITLRQTQAVVQISVRDSGPGISEEALAHIFERFYRADKSRSRTDGGSGLGLTIAKQLTEAHNGVLTAANHPEGGAVFTIALPFYSNQELSDDKE
jgi:signal transduction histidine kinase